MAGALLGSGSRLEAGPATPSGIYVTKASEADRRILRRFAFVRGES